MHIRVIDTLSPLISCDVPVCDLRLSFPISLCHPKDPFPSETLLASPALEAILQNGTHSHLSLFLWLSGAGLNRDFYSNLFSLLPLFPSPASNGFLSEIVGTGTCP